MSSRTARLLVMCGILAVGFAITGVALQAHHAVAGVYDLNKEVVLEGRLKKLNFTNPHASIELSVPDKDGKVTDWVLTTASTQILTREGINKTSMKPGPQGDRPSGEEREPGGIHQVSRARRQRVQDLGRLAETRRDSQWGFEPLWRRPCSWPSS